MMYNEIVRDFMSRTRSNLNFIEKNTCKPEVYETTHLINSLVGMLILPKEQYWEELEKPNFKTPFFDKLKSDKQIYDRYGIKTYRDFVRHMRNAISHFRIEQMCDRKDVAGFKFEDKRNGETTFEIELTNDEIKLFIFELCDGVEGVNTSGDSNS